MNEDAALRLTIFLVILGSMFALELCFPARRLRRNTQQENPPSTVWRLVSNYALLVCSSVCARLVLPIGLAGVALYSHQQHWGLFNQLALPQWLIITLSVLLLDMIIYWQHRLFHKVPLLWRLHQVHHADPHVDCSTALRFHPLEIIASIFIKAVVVIMFGIPASAVLLFEILLNGFAIFNHTNIRLPHRLERAVRTILVTQKLHRIHHSQRIDESNSNFGFSVIWWDKLFDSYKENATKCDAEIEIGLSAYPQVQQNSRLWGLLLMPFKKNN